MIHSRDMKAFINFTGHGGCTSLGVKNNLITAETRLCNSLRNFTPY